MAQLGNCIINLLGVLLPGHFGNKVLWPKFFDQRGSLLWRADQYADELPVLFGLAGFTLRCFVSLAENSLRQIDAEKTDAPESDYASRGQNHSHDGVAPPAGVAEKLFKRAGFFSFYSLGHGFFPGFGFLKAAEHGDGKDGRNRADGQSPAPWFGDGSDLSEAHAD